MFKVLVLIISTLDPNNYAIGASIQTYASMDDCEAKGRAASEADAKKHFPEERVGPVEIYTKCMTAEQADKALEDMREDMRKRRDPKA